jgi:hypothetical protein
MPRTAGRSDIAAAEVVVNILILLRRQVERVLARVLSRLRSPILKQASILEATGRIVAVAFEEETKAPLVAIPQHASGKAVDALVEVRVLLVEPRKGIRPEVGAGVFEVSEFLFVGPSSALGGELSDKTSFFRC